MRSIRGRACRLGAAQREEAARGIRFKASMEACGWGKAHHQLDPAEKGLFNEREERAGAALLRTTAYKRRPFSALAARPRMAIEL